MRRISGLLILTACVDYGLNAPPVQPAEPGEPVVEGRVIEVVPERIDLVGVCGADGATVEVKSVGTEPLTVTGLYLDALGWEAAAPFPIVLQPGESQFVELIATGDAVGALAIDSDDPMRPSVPVPLRAQLDKPPQVSVQFPIAGTGLPLGAFEAWAEVRDDVDPAETLAVRWASDRQGLLSDTPPVLGETGFTWAAPRPLGEHVLTLDVTDSCDNTTTAVIPVCQGEGWTEEDATFAGWQLSGTADWDDINEWLELTPNVLYAIGSAFDTAHPTNAGAVTIDFDFYIGDGSGADGISLTALDTSRATGFLGGNGCGIGYGVASCSPGPGLPGWSIEVDTHYNESVDAVPVDHLAFSFDGRVDSPEAYTVLDEMEDTGWHHMSVMVLSPRVVVAVDGRTALDIVVDPDRLDFEAYVGFTASTGGLTNRHLIDGLAVSEPLCQE